MLIRKDEKWQWGEKQQKAFDKLKQVFMTKPVLAALDLDKEFRVEADASNYATGEVLSIRCSNKKRDQSLLFPSLLVKQNETMRLSASKPQ